MRTNTLRHENQDLDTLSRSSFPEEEPYQSRRLTATMLYLCGIKHFCKTFMPKLVSIFEA